MIKNIEIRKRIANAVYSRYGNLTIEEKKELQNEVGAAMEGYELAIKDIVEWLEDNFNMPQDFEPKLQEYLA